MASDKNRPSAKSPRLSKERHLSARELKELTDDDPDKVPLTRAIILEILEWSFYFFIIFAVFAVIRTFFTSVYESIASAIQSIAKLFGL